MLMTTVQVKPRFFSLVESFSLIENDDDDKTTKAYDHDHQSHHEHGATISVDVHNILDIFKEQLHQTEERILAAIHKQQSSSNAAIVPKSYRTAHRY